MSERALLEQSLSWILAVQHLIFPFQMWMSFAIEPLFEEDSLGWITIIMACMTLPITYSIAASVTYAKTFSPAVIAIKLGLIITICAVTAAFHSGICQISGYLLELTICGFFESWTFSHFLLTQQDRPRSWRRQARLLVLVIAGFMVIPRALSMLGVQTHVTHYRELREGIEGVEPIKVHLPSIIINGVVNEILIFVRPSVFTRVVFGKSHDGGYSLVPGQTGEFAWALRRPNALYQFLIFQIVAMAWMFTDNVISFISHPLASVASQSALYMRAGRSVRHMQSQPSQGLLYLGTGDMERLKVLTTIIWADVTFLDVARKWLDIMLVISASSCAVCVICYGLYGARCLFDRIKRRLSDEG